MSTRFAFPPEPTPSLEITGRPERFPIHRIYCVGRNYEEHAREMGDEPDRSPPFFFQKPADAITPNRATVPYPSRTTILHHEIELVVAIGRGGRDITLNSAVEHIFGYAVGIDLTRRDLQNAAKKLGRPWAAGKAFDASAPVTAIRPVAEIGLIESGPIWLNVNGELRQRADIADMIWSVPEIIVELSTLFLLKPGDLIFTGTPAGVGRVYSGDQLEGGVDELDVLQIVIG